MPGWNEAIKKLHNSEVSKNHLSDSYRRLVFDEICANFSLFLKKEKNKAKIK